MHAWMFDFQLDTASSVRIFVKETVRPSRKKRWHASERVSSDFRDSSMETFRRHSSSCSGSTGTTHRRLEILSSKDASLSCGNSGSGLSSGGNSSVWPSNGATVDTVGIYKEINKLLASGNKLLNMLQLRYKLICYFWTWEHALQNLCGLLYKK